MSELIKTETKYTVYAPDGSNAVLGVYDDEATALAAASAVQAYSDMLADRMQDISATVDLTSDLDLPNGHSGVWDNPAETK